MSLSGQNFYPTEPMHLLPGSYEETALQERAEMGRAQLAPPNFGRRIDKLELTEVPLSTFGKFPAFDWSVKSSATGYRNEYEAAMAAIIEQVSLGLGSKEQGALVYKSRYTIPVPGFFPYKFVTAASDKATATHVQLPKLPRDGTVSIFMVHTHPSLADGADLPSQTDLRISNERGIIGIVVVPMTRRVIVFRGISPDGKKGEYAVWVD